MTARTDAGIHYFAMLSEEEQRDAIKRLARSGMGDHAIGSATGLAVEQIRAILGHRVQCEGCGDE